MPPKEEVHFEPNPKENTHGTSSRPERYQTRPGNTEGHIRWFRRRFHVRADDLHDLAEADRLFGEIGLIAVYENGRITHLRRHFTGTDK